MKEAGQLLKQEGLLADVAHTSLLQRAIRTLWHVLEQTDRMWIPVDKAWQLNERHYGALQGLDKLQWTNTEKIKCWCGVVRTMSHPHPLT